MIANARKESDERRGGDDGTQKRSQFSNFLVSSFQFPFVSFCYSVCMSAAGPIDIIDNNLMSADKRKKAWEEVRTGELHDNDSADTFSL